MPNTREKLIELLREAKTKEQHDFLFADIDTAMDMPKGDEYVAEHLIAHGVTVKECGHWKIIMDEYDCEMMCCSVCGSEFYDGDNDTVDCLHNYCPHCGAKMLPQPPKGE